MCPKHIKSDRVHDVGFLLRQMPIDVHWKKKIIKIEAMDHASIALRWRTARKGNYLYQCLLLTKRPMINWINIEFKRFLYYFSIRVMMSGAVKATQRFSLFKVGLQKCLNIYLATVAKFAFVTREFLDKNWSPLCISVPKVSSWLYKIRLLFYSKNELLSGILKCCQ